MRGLTSSEVLAVWELGGNQSPARRALTMLAPVCAGETVQSLAALPVGRRDARLLELRERTFGRHFSSLARCPNCDEQVQADFETTDIRAPAEMSAPLDDCRHHGFIARLRLPDSNDLEVSARAPDAVTARRELVARCLVDLQSPRAGPGRGVEELPEAFVSMMAARIAAADPQADAQLSLTCSACGHRWNAPFDIAEFFWTELQTCARRLLGEVHELAAAYGWREADILALSPARRAAYLGLVRG